MEKICICIKNIGVWHSFEKNETATMFFLKKAFLVNYVQQTRGMSRIFERGGPISLGSLKKGHQILKGGGSNGLIVGGGSNYIRLPRTTNFAYLDAKE